MRKNGHLDLDWREHPHAPPPGTPLCTLAEIDAGTARVFSFGSGMRPLEILVVRAADDVRAYVNLCAHLPLPLNIDARVHTRDEQIYCDHHYAAFRFSDGLCVAGACRGESLAAVPLTVRGVQIALA